MTPTPADVRLQLDRILASDSFAGADRARRFLRYVVERTLTGEGDQLKEFAIGIDVFDRGEEYDPRIDSIVRVEAGRLRARLEQYYQQANGSDHVVIQMRRGSYVPMFEQRVTECVAPTAKQPFVGRVLWTRLQRRVPTAFAKATASPPERFARRRKDPPYVIASIALVAALAAGAWLAGLWSPVSTPPPVVVAVLPLEHFSTGPGDELLAARVTEGVTSELVHIEGVSVVARRNALQFAESGLPIQEAVKVLNAEVVVEGSLVVQDERIQVDVRLVNPGAARKTWGRRFEAGVNEVGALQREVATAVAEAASERQRHP